MEDATASEHINMLISPRKKIVKMHNLLLSIPKVAEELFEGRLNNRQLVYAMHPRGLEKAEERMDLM